MSPDTSRDDGWSAEVLCPPGVAGGAQAGFCQDIKCQGLSLAPVSSITYSISAQLIFPLFPFPNLLFSLALWSSCSRDRCLTPLWCLGERQTDSCYRGSSCPYHTWPWPRKFSRAPVFLTYVPCAVGAGSTASAVHI